MRWGRALLAVSVVLAAPACDSATAATPKGRDVYAVSASGVPLLESVSSLYGGCGC